MKKKEPLLSSLCVSVFMVFVPQEIISNIIIRYKIDTRLKSFIIQELIVFVANYIVLRTRYRSVIYFRLNIVLYFNACSLFYIITLKINAI